MKRCDELHAPLAYSVGNFTHNVLLRAKQLAIPRCGR